MAASTQAHDWAVTQLKPLLRSLGHQVCVQTEVTASKRQHRRGVQLREYLPHNGAPRDLVFDLTLTRERYGAAEDPSKVGHLRHPTNINKLPQEAARRQNATRLADYAVDRRISFLPAVCSTSGRIDAELLRLLCHHAHRESEEFFKLTGQLAQPNQDSVFSKRPAFFDSLKKKVGHIMAKACAL